jgi:hypothetical protein
MSRTLPSNKTTGTPTQSRRQTVSTTFGRTNFLNDQNFPLLKLSQNQVSQKKMSNGFCTAAAKKMLP